MGTAALARGDEVIRRHRKADERRAGAAIDAAVNENARLREALGEAQAENARLAAEVERATNAAKRHMAMVDVQREEIAAERGRGDYWKGLALAVLKGRDEADRGRRILYEVIKLGMEPERYHELRAIVGDQFDSPAA